MKMILLRQLLAHIVPLSSFYPGQDWTEWTHVAMREREDTTNHRSLVGALQPVRDQLDAVCDIPTSKARLVLLFHWNYWTPESSDQAHQGLKGGGSCVIPS